MQTELQFSSCSIADSDQTPKWKQLLRALLMRRLEQVPWISIMELREITQCQSADVRIRELRRRLDADASNMNNLESLCLSMLTGRRLMQMVNQDDIYMPEGSGMANIRSSIAIFRVKHGDGWIWVYLLNMEEGEIRRIVGEVWD